LAFDGERGFALGLPARSACRLSLKGRDVLRISIVIHAIRHITRLAVVVETPTALACMRALPTRRGVARAEGIHLVEAGGAVARHAEAAGRGFLYLDMGLWQLVEEARRTGRRPQAVDATVGGEIDLRKLARARQADMGQATLFLEAGTAAFVERALMREQTFLPARQEDAVELKALGRVQRHDIDGLLGLV